MSAAPRVLHETARRLRLRLSPARLTRVAAAVGALDGVTSVRLAAASRSLAVEHDGRDGVRAAILALAADPCLPEPHADSPVPGPAGGGADPVALARAVAVLVASLVLPVPLARVLTLAHIARPVWRGLRAAAGLHLKVEVLDALALSLPVLRGNFATANFTLALVELANYIEATTVEKSDELLRSLLAQKPADVWVESTDGQVERRAFDALAVGDRVVVGLGEAIPVDGMVVAGDAYVDQSAVTGENLPVPRAPGHYTLAGGIVTEGRLVIRAERVGAESLTGRIAGYIEDALARPAEIQCAATRMADRRVGITLASAAGVFAVTRDWRRLEAVFQVDYSCTVKLGTPIAVKSAMYRAAREGCLVKSGQALEALAGVDTLVFDKTGTLTHNALEVTDIHALTAEVTETEAIALIASLGEHTSHPVARAVVHLARERHLAHIDHEAVNFIVGHGVEAQVEGDVIRFGSRHFLEDDEHISFARERALVEGFRQEGKSLLYAARNDRPLAVFALRDRLRAETVATLAHLRRLGIRRMVMITGDHREKALALGGLLGMDEVHFEQQPEDKAAIIEALRDEGARVAYVGDGVNDGPALMAAQVGIAMPRAADIARATADVILVEDRLDGLAAIYENAKRTMALIDSNFRVAVGANSAILLGAVGGVLSAPVTAALHNGTTIAVLLRSLAAR